MRTSIPLIAIVVWFALVGHAKAVVIFEFSFSDNGLGGFGGTHIPGTVTGTIMLPDAGGLQQPISVLIESWPAGLMGGPQTGLEVTDWEVNVGPGFQHDGSQMIGFDWGATDGDSPDGDAFSLSSQSLLASNLLSWDGLNTVTANNLANNGVTFTLVPEPSAIVMAAIAGLAALFCRRRGDEARQRARG